MHLSILLISIVWVFSNTSAASPLSIEKALGSAKWSQNTTIAYPASSRFQNATERWTIFDPPTFSAVITPGTEDDVQIARKNKIPFLATGGRHGYGTSLGKLDNGLAIDLSQLKSVHVDAEAGTMTIGGGAIFDDIFEPVFEAGYEIQTGSCSCVGMLGATLGGGIGRYQNLHGLVADALVSVRMITAQGKIVTASAETHADLFWGLRGAGANFGIVTSATYKLARQTNKGQAFSVDFVFPQNASRAFFKALAGFQDELPQGLSAITLVVWDEASSAPQIMTNWVYAGTEEEGRRILKPLFNLHPPTAVATMIPWDELVYTAGFGLDAAFCQGPAVRSIYTASLRTLDAATFQGTFDKMSALYKAVPAARSSAIEIELLGAVADEDTAYPWRDAVAYTMLQMSWEDDNAAEAANKLGRELRRDFERTSGYPGLAAYVNYAHGDESLEAIYGKDKLRRLSDLKRRWDPDNVFGYNNALSTKA